MKISCQSISLRNSLIVAEMIISSFFHYCKVKRKGHCQFSSNINCARICKGKVQRTQFSWLEKNAVTNWFYGQVSAEKSATQIQGDSANESHN